MVIAVVIGGGVSDVSLLAVALVVAFVVSGIEVAMLARVATVVGIVCGFGGGLPRVVCF